MAGKHRLRLVCSAVGFDPITVPSNVRACADCGAQVWVSPGASTDLVDSGQLRPQCPTCWLATGKALTLHPATIAELASMGKLEMGWRRVAEENDQG